MPGRVARLRQLWGGSGNRCKSAAGWATATGGAFSFRAVVAGSTTPGNQLERLAHGRIDLVTNTGQYALPPPFNRCANPTSDVAILVAKAVREGGVERDENVHFVGLSGGSGTQSFSLARSVSRGRMRETLPVTRKSSSCSSTSMGAPSDSSTIETGDTAVTTAVSKWSCELSWFQRRRIDLGAARHRARSCPSERR